ncbi:MAG: GTPase HflX [Pleurocapsa sp. SU_196_0]|nr:GTPase HflX [Pleurocapsa sp. SU_196_0]
MEKVHGNINGLKPSVLKQLGNLYRRKTPPSSAVTPELARSITELALEINREVSLLVDRRGRVVTVSVGDANKMEFPNLQRGREAESRLRGLWLVHAHPKPGPLSKGDLSTLFLNRLDAIVAIEVRPDGVPGQAHLAHLTPPNASLEEEDWRVYPPQSVQALEDWDIAANTRALESEFARQEAARETKKSSEERAILVQIDRGSGKSAEEALEELNELARTAGAVVVWKELTYRKHAKADTLIGRGKLEELTSRAYHLDADTLIFGEELSPAQAREIEGATGLKIIDRTQLILDIFAQHASGQESAQQVELAQLRYMKPRLLGQGTKLSKIGGGAAGSGGAIGTRGPGETKLELDRRRINDRIAFLERGLKDLSQRQQEKRKNRLRSGIPTIGIVGYTNAGKSTLLNALTHSSVLAENKLFATLTPTSRRGYVADYGEVVFTDTVGFIRELPDDLKRAFRSTLQELQDVDVLLHVLDTSSDGAMERFEAVEDILSELELGAVPKLLVLNKIDRADPFDVESLQERLGGVAVSAAQKIGLNELRTAVMNTVMHHRAMAAATLEAERARQLEFA